MSETTEQQGGNGNCDVHLHAEVEVLKQALVDKQTQLIAMETACLRESDRQVELEDSIIAWQDKYDRLYESHKRVQKVNQTLEDKLLKLVDRNSGERAQLTSDVATLSVRLAQANYNIAKLQHEIERYKTDINLAIQLLQCKPDSFVPQKVSSLPVEIQSKVSTYMRLETNSHSDSEGSTSGVGLATSGSYKVLPASDSPPPLCPFPPTAMVYSMRGLDARNNSDCNSNGDQMISPSAMAKYLQDELNASEIKHCDTCNCSPKDLTVLVDEPKVYSVGTQTIVQSESGNSLCLRCNSNLNSPSRTNSPYIMKIVKSSDSVISETKSSVSDLLDNEKLFTPAKKDDLMVNPILGHHRLCDRTVSKQQQQQISDTAKYIVETRKLENEIADLRKFNNKSPNLSLGAELCNTFSRNLTGANEVKLCDIDVSASESAAGQNGSAILISDTVDENVAELDTTNVEPEEEHQEREPEQEQVTCTSPKSDASAGTSDNKSEQKLQPDANSSRDSNDKNINNNMGTTITGSTNSLWSKSSSSEGAKLFENFNRNLIKTIKAENPLHRGPRLCALRIQNGSNNILLDNIDSEVTPIVYTRPLRFLDEELDDTKDIITSKISMLLSKQNACVSSASSQINSPSGAKPSTVNSQQELSSSGLANITTESESIVASPSATFSDCHTTQINPSTENYCNAMVTMQNATSLELSLDSHHGKHSPLQLQKNQQHSILDMNEAVLGNGNCKLPTNNEVAKNQSTCPANFEVSINPAIYASLCSDQHQHWNGFIVDVHQNSQSKPHCDIMMLAGDNSLNSSFKNTTTKSGTQSSSVSSSGLEIDVEESALLRRQQLTRVAEWVQNNSQQQQQIHLTGPAKPCCAQNLGSNLNHSIATQSSLSRNSNNSIETTNYQAIKHIPMSRQLNTLNNNFHPYHSNTPLQHIQLTSAPKDFKTTTNDLNSSSDVTAQSNLHSSNQDVSVKPKNASMQSVHKATLMQFCNNVDHEKQQHVDLAQMEYNVKQFLLKQNEWSIRNVSDLSNSSSNTQNASQSASSPERKLSVENGNIAGNGSVTSNLEKHTAVKNLLLPFRTETNL